MPDQFQRFKLLEAIQNGELVAAPVHPLPKLSNKFALAAYNKIIGKKGMRRYWLMTKRYCIMITVPEVNFRTFIHATLGLVPKDKNAKMFYSASSEEPGLDSVSAHGPETSELKANQEQCLLKQELDVSGDILQPAHE